MRLLENLKLARWYRIALYLGSAMISALLYFKIEFITEQKHILGIGIGMLLTGIAYVMYEKYSSKMAYDDIVSTKISQNDFLSLLLIILGIGLIELFGLKLILSI
ncbi:hypothetical protein A9Q86_04835 [Flavobacteriales bacterium 33_180_T64]|nr:hypothetical protein A9Q86_04835 [Flavobacteriales bacterium 33_180_T64]